MDRLENSKSLSFMKHPLISRRTFLGCASTLTLATMISAKNSVNPDSYPVVGQGDFQYRVHADWALQNRGILKVKDCHEMVQDARGRLIMITNETANNVLIFDRSGKVVESWGQDFPGGHGLTYWNAGGEEFLFITDHDRHQVFKTTLSGEVLLTLDWPEESGVYSRAEDYSPTETAIGPNGDIYVADGYGSQYILQYDMKGKFIRSFGGKGKIWEERRHNWKPDIYPAPGTDADYADHHLSNAHGVTLDARDANNPVLLVTSRMDNQLKRFSLDGTYLNTIELPGAYVNRAVIHGDHLYASVLRSDHPLRDNTGFVTILDKDNKVVSNPSGSKPEYSDGKLSLIQQREKIFLHPHDVCIDNDENLYVPQWNSGNSFPIKLEKV